MSFLFEKGAYMNLHFTSGVYMYRNQNGHVTEIFSSPNATFQKTYYNAHQLASLLHRQTNDVNFCYGEYFNAGRNITYQKFNSLSELLQ